MSDAANTKLQEKIEIKDFFPLIITVAVFIFGFIFLSSRSSKKNNFYPLIFVLIVLYAIYSFYVIIKNDKSSFNNLYEKIFGNEINESKQNFIDLIIVIFFLVVPTLLVLYLLFEKQEAVDFKGRRAFNKTDFDFKTNNKTKKEILKFEKKFEKKFEFKNKTELKKSTQKYINAIEKDLKEIEKQVLLSKNNINAASNRTLRGAKLNKEILGKNAVQLKRTLQSKNKKAIKQVENLLKI